MVRYSTAYDYDCEWQNIVKSECDCEWYNKVYDYDCEWQKVVKSECDCEWYNMVKSMTMIVNGKT